MGLTYEQVPRDTQNGETRSADYLALNPAGKVPVLDDDGFVLRESLTITFYLAASLATWSGCAASTTAPTCGCASRASRNSWAT